MSFEASAYLKGLASAQHSDYTNSYSQLQEFFDKPVTQLTNDGAYYIRASLAVRGTATCSCINLVKFTGDEGQNRNRQISNYNANVDGLWNEATTLPIASGDDSDARQTYTTDERIKFWLSFSTACGPFNQITICNDSQKLWDTSIYAREQAVIASNSLTDQCTANFVTVSPLESIVQGKSHCGVFIDIPVSAMGDVATSFNYLIPCDIILVVQWI
ncbi:MAG: hypothetical protein EZS28_026022 [Streblomastix strix]|uniref:Uncharacterized protein n=1 Tax=Streblomastix strix TaxID=222440 RepID=A0A5J4V7M5_9EUKA|nr:MAG: hypothetical protein EZS28_026022 [Streblomastix strix]